MQINDLQSTVNRLFFFAVLHHIQHPRNGRSKLAVQQENFAGKISLKIVCFIIKSILIGVYNSSNDTCCCGQSHLPSSFLVLDK